MRSFMIAATMIMVNSATSAFATAVPEIDASAGITAMGVVGAIFALALERRRQRKH